MAVVSKSAEFAILDELAYFNNIYAPLGLQLKPDLYRISAPFRMDSQTAALLNNYFETIPDVSATLLNNYCENIPENVIKQTADSMLRPTIVSAGTAGCQETGPIDIGSACSCPNESINFPSGSQITNTVVVENGPGSSNYITFQNNATGSQISDFVGSEEDYDKNLHSLVSGIIQKDSQTQASTSYLANDCRVESCAREEYNAANQPPILPGFTQCPPEVMFGSKNKLLSETTTTVKPPTSRRERRKKNSVFDPRNSLDPAVQRVMAVFANVLKEWSEIARQLRLPNHQGHLDDPYNVTARQTAASCIWKTAVKQATAAQSTAGGHIGSKLGQSLSSKKCNQIILNQSAKPIVDCRISDHFLIPSQSGFFLGSASQGIDQLASSGPNRFGLIVIDPPWENKSVKRKRTYSMANEWSILRKSLSQLGRLMNDEHGGAIRFEEQFSSIQADGTPPIVFVWVTNNERIQNFVKTELFDSWNVRYVTTWYWLKLTMGGGTVVPFSQNWKQPFETIIIGMRSICRTTLADSGSSSSTCGSIIDLGVGDNKTCRDCVNFKTLKSTLPDKYVIASVPSVIHSRKPPLLELIKQFLPQFEAGGDSKLPEILEIYGRYLVPNCFTIGDEAILLQHLSYFRKL